MERIYYALWYRLDKADAFLLWYSDDVDGVVVDEQGAVLSFGDLDAVQRWASTQGWEVEIEQLVLHDLDAIEQWSEHPSPDTVNCVAILNAWNMFIDMRASLEQRNVLQDDPENDALYDKVFFGSNLPSMTPPGEQYIPAWSNDEVERLSRILTEGLGRFRTSLKRIKTAAV